MTNTPETQRVVIELTHGDGPITGRFIAQGREHATSFAGWLELVALLESVRRDPGGEPQAAGNA